MPMTSEFHAYLESLAFAEVIPNTRVTAAGTTQSAWIPLGEYEGNVALVLQAPLASAGTSPTLDVTIEHRVDASDTPAALPASSLKDPDGTNGTFTQVTDAVGAGLQMKAIIRAEARAQIRVTVTVTGTSSPTFDFSMMLVAADKYGSF